MNVRGEVHAYLPQEHYRRLKLEAAARRVSLSQCVADCLREYFALRQEMATALETPAQPGELSRRVIHVLLAETEQRLVATFERYVDDLAAVRGGVDALLAMSDRAEFLSPCARPPRCPRRPTSGHWRAASGGSRTGARPWPACSSPRGGLCRGPWRNQSEPAISCRRGRRPTRASTILGRPPCHAR